MLDSSSFKTRAINDTKVFREYIAKEAYL
jgi:hypothetical protein